MYLYAELWNARPAWHALSTQERAEYLTNLGPAIGGLLAAGVEVVGWAVTEDEDTPHHAAYRYLAVWKMPDMSLVQQLEAAVEGAGWYHYFEQINSRGLLGTPDDVIGDMIRL